MRIVTLGGSQDVAGLRLAPRLFCLDRDLGSENVFVRLSQSKIVELRPLVKVSQVESAISEAIGQVIVAVTANPDNPKEVIALAKRAVFLNASLHRHVHFIALLTGNHDLETIDCLERLGVRVIWRHEEDAIETCVRALAWRIIRRPSMPGPCFYLHYPDCDRLQVFLIGLRGRTELLYGEKLGALFEMLALTHHWATTSQIAKELDISKSSVKVYLDRLRGEYEQKRFEAGVAIAASRVFCSDRQNGVWIHCLRGQVLVLD